MTDPIRDPGATEPVRRAGRTGYWLLYHRNAIRAVLAVLIVGFFLWGLGADSGWAGGATGFAIALALAWVIGEIVWFLVDRASPDPSRSED